eukprot:CAMPEP_0206578244 /NCGR_PEP_ID=MMETSP0325_2-20121206/31849_1 /ASSEMBLY_ACC=CAM_ASM_000347 /TAXON_ID=2866 /ORGANISM="Crypthecodinium cohnii, Strain Seligo" /LENGTH=81 /DNA_ID=CAMNT_0054083849 /DNA_START=631 /DNA_END=876 /DNA_ORIENTATION=-
MGTATGADEKFAAAGAAAGAAGTGFPAVLVAAGPVKADADRVPKQGRADFDPDPIWACRSCDGFCVPGGCFFAVVAGFLLL